MSTTTAGKPPRVYFKIDYETNTKKCPRCMKTHDLGNYYQYEDRGKLRHASWCKACMRKNTARHQAMKRGSGPPKRRSNRFDDRGRVWCPACKQYRERYDFRPHARDESKPHTYCTPCQRELDRISYRYGGKERARKHYAARLTRRRKQRAAELRERRQFVMDAFDLLRRRGFSQADIGRLVDASPGNLRIWAEGKARPGPAIAKYFSAALVATKDYAVQADGKPMRTQRPHPDTEILLDRMELLTRGIKRKRRAAA